jgi:hypothetical protein
MRFHDEEQTSTALPPKNAKQSDEQEVTNDAAPFPPVGCEEITGEADEYKLASLKIRPATKEEAEEQQRINKRVKALNDLIVRGAKERGIKIVEQNIQPNEEEDEESQPSNEPPEVENLDLGDRDLEDAQMNDIKTKHKRTGLIAKTALGTFGN